MWLSKNQSNYRADHKRKLNTIFSQPWIDGIHGVIYSFSQKPIDRIHKWRPSNYSFVFMLINPTSLISTKKIQENFCFKVRLLRMISRNYFLATIYAYGLWGTKVKLIMSATLKRRWRNTNQNQHRTWFLGSTYLLVTPEIINSGNQSQHLACF